MQVLYNGLLSLGTNFPEWSTLGLSINFPNLEIHYPTTEKSHVSNISYKVHMGNTVICRTIVMSTIILHIASFPLVPVYMYSSL